MNPFVLGGAGIWRLWTCHLVHFGPGHALLNLAALAVPFALAGVRVWPRMLLGLFLAAPVLSLVLLPGLAGGTYRGASGLACAAWSMAGFALARERGTRVEGILLLGLLGAKLAVEVWSGAALLPGGGGGGKPAGGTSLGRTPGMAGLPVASNHAGEGLIHFLRPDSTLFSPGPIWMRTSRWRWSSRAPATA
ncbi:MAG: hypothetical protein HGA66_02270 [Holophaga sp.]|nr:hypothetical protein [Holophaga sp.]